jgi:hypothetical protein
VNAVESPKTLRAREPLVGVREIAAYLNVAPSWVYENAVRLGARRLGDGPRARLRFSLTEVDERLSACSAGRESRSPDPAPQAVSRPRRRRGLGTSVDLLPIRGRMPPGAALQEASR